MNQKTATGTKINVSVITSSEVPVPAAVWLLGSGLLGLVAVARRSEKRRPMAAVLLLDQNALIRLSWT
ncbi:MAG: VPLPA-CTERM sorting domain-containing protein [Xanthomonadaceae bacterium]|nr:VPLPA-CTERM sorting domain-containing protein [Xanthomonadaceae bacterium]